MQLTVLRHRVAFPVSQWRAGSRTRRGRAKTLQCLQSFKETKRDTCIQHKGTGKWARKLLSYQGLFLGAICWPSKSTAPPFQGSGKIRRRRDLQLLRLTRLTVVGPRLVLWSLTLPHHAASPWRRREAPNTDDGGVEAVRSLETS